jgi:hypothetical protein
MTDEQINTIAKIFEQRSIATNPIGVRYVSVKHDERTAGWLKLLRDNVKR